MITAGGIIDYIVMCVTYLCFFYATRAQNFDRSRLPYVGWFQPWCGWIGLVWMVLVVFTYGYSSFKPWSVDNFFTYYTMLILAPITFTFWKVVKRTKFVKSSEVDLIWEAPVIDAYESTFYEHPLSFWREMWQLVSFAHFRHGRKMGGDRRRSSVVAREEAAISGTK